MLPLFSLTKVANRSSNGMTCGTTALTTVSPRFWNTPLHVVGGVVLRREWLLVLQNFLKTRAEFGQAIYYVVRIVVVLLRELPLAPPFTPTIQRRNGSAAYFGGEFSF
jgi:hypothetical protein